MNINAQIAKWQATFLLIENSNETFQWKQHKIWTVVEEVTDRYDEIINSPNVTQANIALLFTNVSLYAKKYSVDTRKLQLKALTTGIGKLL